ncbi:MAG TPA: DUF6174 domain-containing protein [Bacteroidota bacterium]|nr:DUF6174 domain-containing protein [Bacteroidota bacterium]
MQRYIMQVTPCNDSISTQTISARRFITIDSLFKMIQSRNYDSIEVTYNVQYGYPQIVDIDPQNHPRDGGIRYETSNLRFQ